MRRNQVHFAARMALFHILFMGFLPFSSYVCGHREGRIDAHATFYGGGDASGTMGTFNKAKDFVKGKKAIVKMPEASLTDIDLKRVGWDSADFQVKVSVKNPYPIAIPVGEIKYTLKSADREIASGTIRDPGSLTANGKTILDVSVKVPYSVLVSVVKDIGGDWDIDYELKVDLIIDLPIIGNVTIPLSRKGEIKLPGKE